MKIIFLTLVRIKSIEDKGIYHDLLRTFRDHGHEIIIVCPNERRFKEKTNLSKFNNISILKVWTPNIQKTNLFEKGISTILIEFLYKKSINFYVKPKKIDLILYSTPPITLINLITSLKKITKAKSYLLLKDIFPQNAIDLGIIKKNTFIYNYFLQKEKKLYEISDNIGCMSLANYNFLISNNPTIQKNKIEINPNSIEVNNISITGPNPNSLREKYKIPLNKVIYIYGGNLGLPQGIEYLIKNIENCVTIKEAFFIIVGDGTEFQKLQNWVIKSKPINTLLIRFLPNSEYEELLTISNVGLVFLHPNFTVPNFPSRILSYMNNKIPILFSVDQTTDVGLVAESNKYGFNTFIVNKEDFKEKVILLLDKNLRKTMGLNGYNFFKKEYNVDVTYNLIIKKL